jgi:hypothetical protein
MLNQRSGLRAFIKDLGLAFVNTAAAAHRDIPWFLRIHRSAVIPFQVASEIGGDETGIACEAPNIAPNVPATRAT